MVFLLAFVFGMCISLLHSSWSEQSIFFVVIAATCMRLPDGDLLALFVLRDNFYNGGLYCFRAEVILTIVALECYKGQTVVIDDVFSCSRHSGYIARME